MTAPVIEVMRKRHVKHVMAIESAVHRKPWSASVFNTEIDLSKKVSATTSCCRSWVRSSATPD